MKAFTDIRRPNFDARSSGFLDPGWRVIYSTGDTADDSNDAIFCKVALYDDHKCWKGLTKSERVLGNVTNSN